MRVTSSQKERFRMNRGPNIYFRTVEIRHVEEVEQEEFESRPIDPNNPEELSKHKQLRNTDTFSQILLENKGDITSAAVGLVTC